MLNLFRFRTQPLRIIGRAVEMRTGLEQLERPIGRGLRGFLQQRLSFLGG
jgi:hypothetical protein